VQKRREEKERRRRRWSCCHVDTVRRGRSQRWWRRVSFQLFCCCL